MSYDPLDTPTPADHAAELALAGCAVLFPDSLDEIAQHARPDMLYSMFAAAVLTEAQQARDRGEPVDAVLLAEQLRRHDEPMGGWPLFLARCMETVPHAGHAAGYARRVREKWTEREVTNACIDALRDLRDAATAAETVARLESQLHRLMEADASGVVHEIRDVLTDLFAAMAAGEVPGLPTGWPDLDALLNGGLGRGTLTILAARPSVGKTALAGNLAISVGRRGGSVLFVSLEQSRDELAERLLSSLSAVDAARLKSRKLTDRELVRLQEARERLAALPVAVDDGAARTVAQIAAAARLRKRRRGLDLLVLDYVQLVAPEDRRIPREQQVAAVSRALKHLATDLRVPVVCLAQLSRAIETRESKRPRLSDLRESGSLEQDADAVLFLDRPATYDPEAEPSEARLIVAKHRHGRTGDVLLHFDGATMTFHSAALPGQREGGF